MLVKNSCKIKQELFNLLDIVGADRAVDDLETLLQFVIKHNNEEDDYHLTRSGLVSSISTVIYLTKVLKVADVDLDRKEFY